MSSNSCCPPRPYSNSLLRRRNSDYGILSRKFQLSNTNSVINNELQGNDTINSPNLTTNTNDYLTNDSNVINSAQTNNNIDNFLSTSPRNQYVTIPSSLFSSSPVATSPLSVMPRSPSKYFYTAPFVASSSPPSPSTPASTSSVSPTSSPVNSPRVFRKYSTTSSLRSLTRAASRSTSFGHIDLTNILEQLENSNSNNNNNNNNNDNNSNEKLVDDSKSIRKGSVLEGASNFTTTSNNNGTASSSSLSPSPTARPPSKTTSLGSIAWKAPQARPSIASHRSRQNLHQSSQ